MKSMFGNRLREVRESRKKTQGQLAEIVGKSTVTYGAWERGDNEPPLDSLVKICNYLRVSSDWLLGLETAKAPVDVDAMRAEAGEAAEKLRRLVKQLEGMK